MQIYNAPHMSIRKRIWSAEMAPERLHIAVFEQFSFKTVFKCQKCISWTATFTDDLNSNSSNKNFNNE